MQKVRYTIVSNREVASGTFRLVLEGDCSSFERGGQFADIALDGFFLRRPIAATSWGDGRLEMYYKVVGEGTEALSKMAPGACLDVLAGLGNGFDASACKRSALVVCGGLGASPAFTLVRDLLASGRSVRLILGFNTAADAILLDEYRALGVEPEVVTMDGTLGAKGLVTDVMGEPDCDFFYTCGPKVMMRAVCERMKVNGEASLEERMGCGCGICYGCTCKTTSGPRRVCADGPVFRKEEIIW
ncbi:MAG: dihydroorotate dehydrogenase electron transfer subunit [Bacteroidales bacterium]|nr:dihydroorotate dehydrogenase electron transfer subunit [Bacteroidales bacterium]